MVGNPTSAANAATYEGELHVFCCINQPEPLPGTLADRVEAWIRKHYDGLVVTLKQKLPSLDEFQRDAGIDFITIADLISGKDVDFDSCIEISQVDIKVHIFELHGDEEQIEPSEATLTRIAQDADDDDVPRPQARIMNLPNKNLHGLWDSFFFEEPIHFRLLETIIRTMSFSARQRGQNMPSSSRIVLLCGPPGTGKTSLCRALAQQLSIRLGNMFPLCKLVEFDAHSMFSQYFGESGQIVNKVFALIGSMLEEDENTLICVFFDDIDTLADKRQYAGTSDEPNDALKAVSAFLKALDRVRCRRNILIFCTSKSLQIMDSALLDRIDIKQNIPHPGPKARYDILRSCYFDLARSGIIAPMRQISEIAVHQPSVRQLLLEAKEDELSSRWASPTRSSSSSSSADRFYTPLSTPRPPPYSTRDRRSKEGSYILDDGYIPAYPLVRLHFSYIEKNLPHTLYNIAVKSTNLSGRTLRRLPEMSLAMSSKQDPCPIDDAVEALSQAVDNELLREQKEGTGET